MSEGEVNLANWRLGSFFITFLVNAFALAIGVFMGNTQDLEGAMHILVWSMIVGVSSTWLAIVHILICRAKTQKSWQILYYFLPGIIMLLVVKYVDLPIPGKKQPQTNQQVFKSQLGTGK